MDLKSLVWYCFLGTFLLESFPFSTQVPVVENTPISEPLPPVDYDIRMHNDFTGPLVIEFCESCSYKGRVNEIKTTLNNVFPELQVVEEVYPIPFPWSLIAQIAGLICMVAGDHVFGYLQIPYPAWYMYMKNNKIQAGIIMFFGLNLVSSWASSTGAFEIIYNGTILYSGIKTGRMPSVEEVMGILKNI